MSKHKYKYLFALSAAIIISSFVFPSPATAQMLQKYEFKDFHMGTTFQLVFYAKGDSISQNAAHKVFQKIENLDTILSDYNADSELNSIGTKSGSKQWISVSTPLYHVLKKSQEVSKKTDGAFDITVGPYVKLWRKLNQYNNPELPSPDTLTQLSKSVGYRFIKLNTNRQAVQLLEPNMQLDLGGIAKGFAADEALKTLRSNGIYSAFVDAGGDIRIGNPPPEKDGWQIGIHYHQSNGKYKTVVLTLANKAIATSGDLYQHLEINGKQYSHIVNPKTGIGLTNQSTITVIASDGITADSYASAISVLGPKKGISLLENHHRLEGFIEFHQEGRIKHIWSSGLKKIQKLTQE